MNRGMVSIPLGPGPVWLRPYAQLPLVLIDQPDTMRHVSAVWIDRLVDRAVTGAGVRPRPESSFQGRKREYS